jgi:hypothetical protein
VAVYPRKAAAMARRPRVALETAMRPAPATAGVEVEGLAAGLVLDGAGTTTTLVATDPVAVGPVAGEVLLPIG